YLAGWFDGMGETVATSADRFQVLDEDGATVYEGPVVARPVGRDLGERDLTGTPVAELDFSAVTEPGGYRVCVIGVGCSYEVTITDNPWTELAVAVARSTYHQRSGVALGPPHTSFTRPRPYHPDDGLDVLATDYSLLQANAEPEIRFDAIVGSASEVVVDEAWGGHFDAGDWDRRIHHLWYARNAAQLVAAFPREFADDLHIPESGDAVPDLLDEALWSLDFYRRLQLPDGAIRGGVEASEHPPANSTSWLDDLAVYAFAPDPWSSFLYAGVAAEVADALRPYDPARADDYVASAVAAYDWAAGQPVTETQRPVVDGQRNVAAAGLLLATGDPRWHQAFVETADYLTVGFGDDAMLCHAHTRCDGGWLYLQADESATDPAIRQVLRDRFIASAQASLALAENTAYRWTTEDGNVPLVWGLGPGGAPHTSGLLRAYLLSGDERFRAAAVASAGYSLGANPFNQVLITGFGKEQARHPVIVDVQHGGIPVWPGTPVYGHHQLNAIGNDQWAVEFVLGPAGAEPAPDQVPFLWQWYDVPTIAFFNEFTVHQSHAEALFSFGVLAATG
ncbi:MAG: glycoside hydrolase family 9 protein, partial [Actinomycetota bacterium]